MKPVLEVLVLIIGIGVLMKVNLVNKFHSDEAGWATESKVVGDLVLKETFDLEKWRERRSVYGAMNPNLGKLIIGIPASWMNVDVRTVPYDWKMSPQANIRRGAFPKRNQTYLLRIPVLMFAVTALALIWHMVLRLTGSGVMAFLGTLGVLNLQGFLLIGTHVLTDIFYVCALLGFVLLGFAFGRIGTLNGLGYWSLAMGLLTAAAASTKVTGTLMLGPVAAGLLGVWCWERGQGVRKWGQQCAIYMGACAIGIYACNPQWWVDFSAVDSTEALRELRKTRVEGVNWSAYASPWYSQQQQVVKKYPQLTNLTAPLGYIASFPRFKGAFEVMRVGQYEGNRILGVLEELFWRGNGYGISPLMLPLMLVGVGAAGVRVIRSLWVRQPAYPEIVLILCSVVWWGFLIVTMPFPSPRFILPGKLLIVLLAAYGLQVLVLGVWRWIRRAPRRNPFEVRRQSHPNPG